MTFPIIAAALLLASAFVTDIWRMIIPNKLTLFFFAAGIVYRLAADGWSGGASALFGTAAGALPLLLLYVLKGIGAGDVKLFGTLGVWLGPELVLRVMMYSILYAGAIGLLLMLANRPFARRMLVGTVSLIIPGMEMNKEGWLSWAKEGKKFPFMLAVIPGAITVWLFM